MGMSMEHCWNKPNTDRGKQSIQIKQVPLPLCPAKIPPGLTQDKIQASALKGQSSTTSVTAQFSWKMQVS